MTEVPSRIIFLDFDGVLNSARWLATQQGWKRNVLKRFDPDAVARLNHITHTTDANIVVSSSWRYRYALPRLRSLLESVGVHGHVSDIIPAPGFERVDFERWEAIRDWLDGESTPFPQHFIILEDEEPMADLEPRCVRTTYQHGLLDLHVERAITLLL